MNKTQLTILISLCCLSGAGASASPVDRGQALESAKAFFESRSQSSRARLLDKAATPSRSSDSRQPFHIFNLPDDGGFIVISGDDRARTVLAYSYSGSLDPDSPLCSQWLGYYADEIASISESAAAGGDAPVVTSTPIEPLLKSKWDQAYPYNAGCPKDIATTYPTLTGCVATATAQVMYFHRHPLKPTGTVEYRDKTQGVDRSLDLSTYTFDWDNMLDTYGYYPTTAQRDAVADLMLCVGHASKMQYGPEVSIANHRDAAKALVENFGYDPNIRFYNRDFMTEADWNACLLGELSAGRPVIYDGHGDNGGHTFVCDGYDGAGLFHFNWGWSGKSDDYYQLSALRPGSQGSGATSADYSRNHTIICGIMPAGKTESTPQTDHLLGIDILYVYAPGVKTYADGMEFTGAAGSSGFSFYCWNNSARPFSGEVSAAALVEGKPVTISSVSAEIAPGSYKQLTFPVEYARIPDGNYRVGFSYTLPGDNECHTIRSKTGTPHEADLEVKGFDITFGPSSESGIESPESASAPEISIADGRIDILSASQISSVTLTDISGRLRANLTDCGNAATLSTSSLAHGIYILEVRTEGAPASVTKIIL